MLQSRRNSTLGFTLVEVMLALAIFMAALLLGAQLLRMYNKHLRIQRTRTIYRKLEVTIPAFFDGVISAMKEEGCYGLSNCPGAFPLPVATGSEDFSFYLYVPSSWKSYSALVHMFDFCDVQEGDPTIVVCSDFKGDPMKVTPDPSGPWYTNGQDFSVDTSAPYVWTITSKGLPDYEIDLAPVIYSHASDIKPLETIATAMKKFATLREVEEGTFKDQMCDQENDTGGLDSSLDLYVPWIWMAMNSSPEAAKTKCHSSPCGCANIEWRESGRAVLDASNIEDYKRFLANIGLPSMVPIDGLGNLIRVRVIISGTSGSFSDTVSLPKPTDNQTVLQAHESGSYPWPVSSLVYSVSYQPDENGNYPVSRYVAY